MDPSSIRTFMSLTHAPSMLRRVLFARSRPSLIAASNPLGEVALISVTVATLITYLLVPTCTVTRLLNTPAHRPAKHPRAPEPAALRPHHETARLAIDKRRYMCKLRVRQKSIKSLHYRIHTTSSQRRAMPARRASAGLFAPGGGSGVWAEVIEWTL